MGVEEFVSRKRKVIKDSKEIMHWKSTRRRFPKYFGLDYVTCLIEEDPSTYAKIMASHDSTL